MTDETIADIAREKTVLDNTEWFEGQDGSGSFKSHVGSIRGVGVVALTSSSTPQDIGANAKIILVTSSGSGAGDDVLNLVNPTLDGNGQNLSLIGQQVIVALNTVGNVNDVVSITVEGSSAAIPLVNPGFLNALGATTVANISLAGAGTAVCFRWGGLGWVVDGSMTGGAFSAVLGGSVYFFSQGADTSIFVGAADGHGDAYLLGGSRSTTSGTCGSAKVQGGDFTTADESGTAGAVAIRGGNNGATGNGGNVTIDPGAAGDGGAAGHILIGSNVALPTSDPHVANALWSNSGVLTISAG